MDSELWQDLELLSVNHYDYLGSTLKRVPGVNDSAEFEDTVRAAESVGIDEDDRADLWRIVSGILWLGNVKFLSGGAEDSCLVSDVTAPALERCCRLFGIPLDSTKRMLLFKKLTVRGQVYRPPNKQDECCEARDSFSKTIYGHVFSYIVCL